MQALLGLVVVIGLLAVGPWGWAALVVMLIIGAASTKNEKKSASDNKGSKSAVDSNTPSIDFGNSPVQSEGDTRKQAEKLGNTNNWVTLLTEVCSRYTASDYYVLELIPEKKLVNALKANPLPRGGKAIALIVTTLFGAADNGMLIGENGLSWRNLGAESKVSSMPWEEFSKTTLSKNGSKVNFGSDGIFETAGTSLDKDKILELLGTIQIAFPEHQKLKQSSPTTTARVAQNEQCVVNIDVATYDELLSLPSIGAAEAKLILDKRVSGARFASLDEFSDFLSLKPHKVEQLRNRVVFSTPDVPLATDANPLMEPTLGSSPSPKPSSPSSGRVID